MSPDRPGHSLTGSRPDLFDRTIPRGNGVKTRTSDAFAVNMQVGPLVVAPVVAVVLWNNAELSQAGLVMALVLLGAMRRSHLTYRRNCTD